MDKDKRHDPLTTRQLQAMIDLGLDARIVSSQDGAQQYLVLRFGDGSFHVFKEVEAKQAAKNCGATTDDPSGDLHTRSFWAQLWR